MAKNLFLLGLLLMGFLAESRLIILVSLLLLFFQQLGAEEIFSFLGERGIELGLIFLLLAILSPLLLEPIKISDFKEQLFDYRGLIAFIAGIAATRVNGMGLELLDDFPKIILSVIIGSIFGIFFLGGIPVGPLMPAGLAAVIIKIFELIFIK